MTSLLHSYFPFFSSKRKARTLAASSLLRHDEEGKQDALEAVDMLLNYKTNVHEFTDEIVAHWSMPRKIMQRYDIEDVEQLNEWLDDFS